jgi:hypothetical protein
MGIIKAIVEKFKIKELIAILFVAAFIITVLPKEMATKLNIVKFRDNYQTYISLCLIVTGAYYILSIMNFIKSFFFGKIFNWKRTALNYMKRYMSSDEMGLLIETFYDKENNRFKSSGMIEFTDGRKAALESKHVLYRASSMSEWYSFAYNLQPSVREFLNKNLVEGNIQIGRDSFKYVLK